MTTDKNSGQWEFMEFYIPERMREAMLAYTQEGREPGDFLKAVICNDLKESCHRADEENLRNLPAFVYWFYQWAPAVCWGSEDRMNSWLHFKKFFPESTETV